MGFKDDFHTQAAHIGDTGLASSFLHSLSLLSWVFPPYLSEHLFHPSLITKSFFICVYIFYLQFNPEYFSLFS